MAIAIVPASASNRCRVTDPTGTPLNVRQNPNGAIMGNLYNGELVFITGGAPDSPGKPWVYIEDQTGQSLGWVLREFISCF